MKLTKILLPLCAGTLLLASPGASIYKKDCKGCHGSNADKIAMGKSKPIKGMSVTTLDEAMKDYASGKRTSMPMVKKLKQDFIKKRSNEEVQAVYKYIQAL